MRNFDELLEQDLAFQIGGEQFTMRYVRPEVLAVWEDESIDEKSSELLKRQDERIAIMLDGEEQRDRWKAMRERDEHALPMVQLNELLRWMIEVQTSRPTNPPLPSVSGRGRTAATSKAA